MGPCLSRQHKPLSPALKERLEQFFGKMDTDGNHVVSREEAIKFWSSRFAKVNAEVFFAEVDQNGNEQITLDEFIKYWTEVFNSGYDESEIFEEIEGMEKGETWKKWLKTSDRELIPARHREDLAPCMSSDSRRSSFSNRSGRISSKGFTSSRPLTPEGDCAGIRLSKRESKH